MSTNENISLSELMQSASTGEAEEQLELQEQEIKATTNDEEQEDTQEQEEQEEQEEPQSNPEMDKASADGWMPKEQWIEQGGNPDDWVSAKKFNERGNMIGQIKSLQKQLDETGKSFEDRLDKVNKFHETQLKVKLAELQSQRRDAIEQADVEAVEEFDSQIEELKAGESKQEAKKETKQDGGFTESDTDLINSWNKENEWASDINDPRTPYVQSRFNIHLQSGKSVEESISLMNKDLSKAFPRTNPQRDLAPKVETKQSRPGQKAVRKMQWSDLTRDEENMYKSMPNAFGSKKEFLQTVEDIRKEG